MQCKNNLQLFVICDDGVDLMYTTSVDHESVMVRNFPSYKYYTQFLSLNTAHPSLYIILAMLTSTRPRPLFARSLFVWFLFCWLRYGCLCCLFLYLITFLVLCIFICLSCPLAPIHLLLDFHTSTLGLFNKIVFYVPSQTTVFE